MSKIIPPSGESLNPNILKAGSEIAATIGDVILAKRQGLARKYSLTDGELVAAIVWCNAQLLAGSVAGMSLGATATDVEQSAAVATLVARFQKTIRDWTAERSQLQR